MLPLNAQLPSMSQLAVDKVYDIEAVFAGLEQTRISISHTFHAGVYARTAKIPAATVITSALIKVPTLVIVSGDAIVFTGEERARRLIGYSVLEASAGRKQVFHAILDTCITMVFASEAKTVDEAEREFTDEYEKLSTRKELP